MNFFVKQFFFSNYNNLLNKNKLGSHGLRRRKKYFIIKRFNTLLNLCVLKKDAIKKNKRFIHKLNLIRSSKLSINRFINFFCITSCILPKLVTKSYPVKKFYYTQLFYSHSLYKKRLFSKYYDSKKITFILFPVYKFIKTLVKHLDKKYNESANESVKFFGYLNIAKLYANFVRLYYKQRYYKKRP